MELIGITIGFESESLRPDRDKYLDVIWDNVYPQDKIYLEALSEWRVNTMDVPYDYTSITHMTESVIVWIHCIIDLYEFVTNTCN